MSDKFKNLTHDLIHDSIQYLPIKIININTNVENCNYKIANITKVIDAFDLEKSNYDIFELDENEKVISVEKYAIIGNRVLGNHIFKLKDDTIPIFVSESIKNIIEKNELTGFDFLQISVT